MRPDCSYAVNDLERCGRTPVVADYWEADPLRGERWVASLCHRHDNPAARRFALARGYERRERVTALSVVTA